MTRHVNLHAAFYYTIPNPLKEKQNRRKYRTVLTVPEMDAVCLTPDENVAGAHDGPELSG